MNGQPRKCEHRYGDYDGACSARAAFHVSRGRKHDAQDSCRRHLAATVDAVMQADDVEVAVTRITGGRS